MRQFSKQPDCELGFFYSWSDNLFLPSREDWERDMMLDAWTWTPENSWERRTKTETETQKRKTDLEEVAESEESKALGYHSSNAGLKESKEG